MKKTPNCFWSFRPDVNFRRLLLPVKIVVLLLFCSLAFPAYSMAADNPIVDDPQQLQVTGTVTDATTGEAMPGVNIQVKGTTQGAITDVANRLEVRYRDCIRCYCCQEFCPQGAITVGRGWALRLLP